MEEKGFRWIDHLDKFPPVIARKEVGKYFSGVIAPKTLANHDYLGTGPKGRLKIGRNDAYTARSLCEWLDERTLVMAA